MGVLGDGSKVFFAFWASGFGSFRTQGSRVSWPENSGLQNGGLRVPKLGFAMAGRSPWLSCSLLSLYTPTETSANQVQGNPL